MGKGAAVFPPEDVSTSGTSLSMDVHQYVTRSTGINTNVTEQTPNRKETALLCLDERYPKELSGVMTAKEYAQLVASVNEILKPSRILAMKEVGENMWYCLFSASTCCICSPLWAMKLPRSHQEYKTMDRKDQEDLERYIKSFNQAQKQANGRVRIQLEVDSPLSTGCGCAHCLEWTHYTLVFNILTEQGIQRSPRRTQNRDQVEA